MNIQLTTPHLVLPHWHVAPEDVLVLVPNDGHGPCEVQAVSVHVMLHVVSAEQLLVVAHSENGEKLSSPKAFVLLLTNPQVQSSPLTLNRKKESENL